MPRRLFPAAAACFALCVTVSAQTGGLLGDWQTPGGSIVRIQRCGAGVCLRLVEVSKQAPADTDIYNPDAALRGRPLCGLEIGRGFRLSDARHAYGGTLYDPKDGRTYRGNLTASGAKLRLRGYIGIPFFGASQDWTRLAAPVASCSGAEK